MQVKVDRKTTGVNRQSSIAMQNNSTSSNIIVRGSSSSRNNEESGKTKTNDGSYQLLYLDRDAEIPIASY